MAEVKEKEVKQKEEFITAEEKNALEILKLKQQAALSEAQKAIALHEKSKMEYDLLVLEIYLDHKLSKEDLIHTDGKIERKQNAKS